MTNQLPRHSRRRILRGLGLAAGITLAGAVPALTASASADVTTVKVGFLHTVGVDAIMYTGIANGTFEAHGVELELTQFDSGIALSQALAGGSVDLAVMGAVISNFPAQGQGHAVIANNIEADTARIWAAPDSGIETVADLEGQKVATVQGTTAHVLLQIAAIDAGIDPASIEIVNSDMATAVNAFLSGAVPALSTWAPNDIQVQEQMPDAVVVAAAGDYFPDAAILGGWVASNDFINETDLLHQVTLGWLDANHLLMTDTENALDQVWEMAYQDNLTREQLTDQFEQLRSYTNSEWAELYEDGSVANWLGQVEQVFVDLGGIDEFVEPEEFFDASLFLAAYAEWSAANPAGSEPVTAGSEA